MLAHTSRRLHRRVEPTSLKGGEGLTVGSIGHVGSGESEGEGCGGQMVVEEGARVSEYQP